MASPDYSKPLATLLRESTHAAHERAETSSGAKLLLNGELPRGVYARFLMMLWHVYDTFEKALDRHSTHPALEPTYNPTLLARAPLLSSDISYLLQVDDWQAHPIHQTLLESSPEPLLDYVERINELAEMNDPSPLLAHAYVRYLGDLSGGQSIRHTIAKAYDLDEASGLGVSFYGFKELRSSKPASQGEMKRIKEWFRAGMNTAGENCTLEAKAAIINEASQVFDLNSALFNLLGLEDTKEHNSTQVQVPLVDQSFPFSSVIAVITAVCLGHFLLVIGGFTGASGYQKLVAVEDWLRSIWQSIN